MNMQTGRERASSTRTTRDLACSNPNTRRKATLNELADLETRRGLEQAIHVVFRYPDHCREVVDDDVAVETRLHVVADAVGEVLIDIAALVGHMQGGMAAVEGRRRFPVEPGRWARCTALVTLKASRRFY